MAYAQSVLKNYTQSISKTNRSLLYASHYGSGGSSYDIIFFEFPLRTSSGAFPFSFFLRFPWEKVVDSGNTESLNASND
jgi:hypothetical protein